MRLSPLVVPTALASLCLAACAHEPERSGALVPIPADRVVERCPEADPDDPDVRDSVQYVGLSDWQSPPAARRAEAGIQARRAAGGPGVGLIAFPPLRLHRGIPRGMTSRRW